MKIPSGEQPRRVKHVPERTCVACRRTEGKRGLVRLVNNGGSVDVDPKGKMPGRGVYLCANRQCWDAGLKGNRVEYGLRVKISSENRLLLAEYGETLPEKE